MQQPIDNHQPPAAQIRTVDFFRLHSSIFRTHAQLLVIPGPRKIKCWDFLRPLATGRIRRTLSRCLTLTVLASEIVNIGKSVLLLQISKTFSLSLKILGLGKFRDICKNVV